MALQNDHLKLDQAEIWTPSGNAVIRPHSEAYEEHFLADHFRYAGCPYVRVGAVPDPALFSQDTLIEGYINIDRLSIKRPGSNEYTIPAELSRYANTIKAIAEDQHARSLAATFKHAVLYVTRSYVHPSGFQRTPNWHRDDGDTISRLIPDGQNYAADVPAHIYIVSDVIRTQVQNKTAHDSGELFGHPHGNAVEQAETSTLLDPYEIGLMNNYVWHRGTRAEQGALRNFLSIMYLPGKEVAQGITHGAFRRPTLNFDE